MINKFIKMMRNCFCSILFLAISVLVAESSFSYSCYNKTCKKKNDFFQSELNPYVSIGGSYALYSEIQGDEFEKDIPDKAPFAHIAVGFITGKTSFELESSYYNNHGGILINNSTQLNYQIRNTSLLLNGYYYFPIKPCIEVFVGVGIGGSYSSINKTISQILTAARADVMKRKDNDFAYQFLLGACMQMNKDFYLESKIRLLSLGRFRDSIETSGDLLNHLALSVGVKYVF